MQTFFWVGYDPKGHLNHSRKKNNNQFIESAKMNTQVLKNSK